MTLSRSYPAETCLGPDGWGHAFRQRAPYGRRTKSRIRWPPSGLLPTSPRRYSPRLLAQVRHRLDGSIWTIPTTVCRSATWTEFLDYDLVAERLRWNFQDTFNQAIVDPVRGLDSGQSTVDQLLYDWTAARPGTRVIDASYAASRLFHCQFKFRCAASRRSRQRALLRRPDSRMTYPTCRTCTCRGRADDRLR